MVICGMFVRIVRPISTSAGEKLHQGRGVARYVSSARNGSFVSFSSCMLDRLHSPLCSAITLGKVWATCGVTKIVVLSKLSEFL